MRIKKFDPTTLSAVQLSESDLASLADLRHRLAGFHDPRMLGKTCFPLPEVILIAFCAMQANCDHFTEFAEFARWQPPSKFSRITR